MKPQDLPRCACGESSGLFMDYGVHRCPMCVARERDTLLEALRPFARMARPDDDPNELACQRGVGCDMTAIFSQDFTAAAAALDGKYSSVAWRDALLLHLARRASGRGRQGRIKMGHATRSH